MSVEEKENFQSCGGSYVEELAASMSDDALWRVDDRFVTESLDKYNIYYFDELKLCHES